MERVNVANVKCVHGVLLLTPCADCKAWRADDPPAGEFSDAGPNDIRSRERRPHSATCDLSTGRHYDNECTCGAEDRVSRETKLPADVRERLAVENVFGEIGVWSPSEADRARWEHNARTYFMFRQIPDWYEWEAEDATWD